MLRRSTSFETRPMPMKIAMNRPKSEVALSPRSLMILTSWPAVSWPSRYDEAMRSTANRTRLYGTPSRPDSLKAWTAIELVARIVGGQLPRAGFGHVLDEEILERVADRVERDERRAGGDQIRQHPVGRLVERQLERVGPGRDLGG